jgi:tRNA(adenine34) deaminase
MNPVTVSAADKTFMTMALDLARAALAAGDFPVGCVLADDSRVIARGRRTGTTAGMANEIDHAELNALRRLYDDAPALDRSLLTVYCTMEPCLMCFSAIVLSGIRRIVYAYEDVMGGGTGGDRTGLPPLFRDARVTVLPGVLRADSLALFQQFFADTGNPYWADSMLSRYTLAQPVGA